MFLGSLPCNAIEYYSKLVLVAPALILIEDLLKALVTSEFADNHRV